jgi:hypothetical protein
MVQRVIQAYVRGFYALYAWNLRTWGARDIPAFNVCLFAGMLLLMPPVAGLLAIDAAIGSKIIFIPVLGEVTTFLLYLCSALAHYLLLIRGKEREMREAVEEYPTRRAYLYGAVAYAVVVLISSTLLLLVARDLNLT